MFAHDAIHLDVCALLGIKLLPAIRGSGCDLFSQLLPPPPTSLGVHVHRPSEAPQKWCLALFNHSEQTAEDTPQCSAFEVGDGGRGGEGAPRSHISIANLA